MKFYKFTSLLILFFCAKNIFAQDPVFSQFYNAPLQLNPAFAGNAYAPFIAANYRIQAPSFVTGSAAYSTYQVSYDQFLDGLNSGIGLSFMSDDQGGGIYKTTYANAYYSYKVNITEQISAKIGVGAGLIQSSIDWNRLIFPDQIDGATGNVLTSAEERPTNLTNSKIDLQTGILVYGPSFYLGLTAKHLASPNQSFLKSSNSNVNLGLPLLINFHAGYDFIIEKESRYKPATFITPSILYVKQSDFAQIMLGAYGGLGPLYAGLWYRHANTNSDAVITMIGYRQEYFKIGYSYDYTVSGLAGKTGGTHEISLTINFDPNPNRIDFNDCFKMFR